MADEDPVVDQSKKNEKDNSDKEKEKEKPKEEPKVFRALRGISLINEDGTEKRYNAGDKMEGFDENSLRSEIDAGTVGEWEPHDTSEVVDSRGESVVYGVTSRKSKGNIVVKGVDY